MMFNVRTSVSIDCKTKNIDDVQCSHTGVNMNSCDVRTEQQQSADQVSRLMSQVLTLTYRIEKLMMPLVREYKVVMWYKGY